ncbi:tyrosine-type recombinase/integrase [Curtobacterium flaccumfaciens]|uniref:tyrosine-type recombinase/integrase n=1 Tax=Curtobacterium flaccumfaciens TaxID=2035 RepID=UPI000FFF5471|nr:site-specific integrase [Curtobacterium flaccumfaciens]MCS0644988.1 site-specific integrase [Curtobacterium flaccumfaciens pv. flaccumfaciens]MCS6526724.1 site-specific integrase [Curtobacterium flaccumfaciens pv. flaccumfaciens]RXF83242.1 site-specific integrase [Curtobacterium flaccumfaciens pv. flaccumfaciens]
MSDVYKRADGSYRARFEWRDDEDRRREKTKVFRLKGDAQRWLDDQRIAWKAGGWVDPNHGVTTLQEYFDQWAPRQVWEPTTVTAMTLAVDKCSFRNVRLDKLRRSHVEQWVKTMTADLAASTTHTRVNNVRSVLRAAVRDKYLGADPSEGVVLPRRRRAAQAMRIPTPAELASVIDAADDWFKTYIRLCAFAGLRLGEASAVQAGDIAFLERRLQVRRQVQRAGGQEVRISPPKYGSERDVYVPDELTAALSWHMSEVGVRGDERWLFVGSGGNPPHGNTIYYWWAKTIAAAGVEPFKLHDCRHFFASGLIAAGCDVVTVQRALGHHSATVTLNTYAHLWPDAEDRTRAATADLIRQVSATNAALVRHEVADTV